MAQLLPEDIEYLKAPVSEGGKGYTDETILKKARELGDTLPSEFLKTKGLDSGLNPIQQAPASSGMAGVAEGTGQVVNKTLQGIGKNEAVQTTGEVLNKNSNTVTQFGGGALVGAGLSQLFRKVPWLAALGGGWTLGNTVINPAIYGTKTAWEQANVMKDPKQKAGMFLSVMGDELNGYGKGVKDYWTDPYNIGVAVGGLGTPKMSPSTKGIEFDYQFSPKAIGDFIRNIFPKQSQKIVTGEVASAPYRGQGAGTVTEVPDVYWSYKPNFTTKGQELTPTNLQLPVPVENTGFTMGEGSNLYGQPQRPRVNLSGLLPLNDATYQNLGLDKYIEPTQLQMW